MPLPVPPGWELLPHLLKLAVDETARRSKFFCRGWLGLEPVRPFAAGESGWINLRILVCCLAISNWLRRAAQGLLVLVVSSPSPVDRQWHRHAGRRPARRPAPSQQRSGVRF